LGKQIDIDRLGAEHLLAHVDIMTVSMVTGQINVTLQPGDVLEINSAVYTAMLYAGGSGAGINVLDQYTGEWIFVVPETIRLIVSTGNNAPFTGSIQWEELYV
jgi:hypothetical protein